MKALRLGDEKALETLFRLHYEVLCQFAMTMLHDKDESEEVVQHLFIQLWEKREKIQVHESLKSYLYQAVRNACLNKIKHEQVKRKYADEMIAGSGPEPSTEFSDTRELQSEIMKAVQELPEQCRIIFSMSRFEELKYSEIAERMGLSVKTVENQMGKALRIMREKLKDYLTTLIIILSNYLF